jgi:hypothetical protein
VPESVIHQGIRQIVDIEQTFVLQCTGSEQVFGKGDAMSVAFELEYEILRPRLRLVPDRPVQAAGPLLPRQRRLVLAMALVVAVLLVLLMLPLRALGGSTLADAGPAVGQTYIVKAGDTLASIAQRTGVGNVAALTSQLATEVGSSAVVPGEHIRIP